MKIYLSSIIVSVIWITALAFNLSAQTTEFTYQGSLLDAGTPANGTYDLQFVPYTAQTGTVQVGSSADLPGIAVTGGNFSVNLDLGTMPFTTQPELWIEVAYRLSGNSGSYVFTGVRQKLKPSPFALRSHFSTFSVSAQNTDTLGGLYPGSFVQNNSSGMPQAGTSVNVSGDVSGFNVNAVNAYHIGFNRVFAIGGDNLYAGINAGTMASPNVTGNSFFGSNAGAKNVDGHQNSFFGMNAGSNNLGHSNSFFGGDAGTSNTAGILNSFVGTGAGGLSTSGNGNTFFGFSAGRGNTTQSFNTLIGYKADVGKSVLNSTAIGNLAKVERSNSVVLGSIAGVNGAEISANVGIGTTKPLRKLEIIDSSNSGVRVQTNSTGGTVASFGGFGDFQIDAPGVVGGRLAVTENGNTGLGTNQPASRLHVNGNLRISNGEIYVTNPNGIILTDSSNKCWRVTVNQSGQLVTKSLFCP